MPYTEDEKRLLYEAHGLSPEDYDIDEVSKTFKYRNAPDPATAPETTTVLQQKPEVKAAPSLAESVARSATESAIPTVASIGAGAGTLALSSWLGGPVTGVPITAAALLASLGAGIGASAAQRKVIPQETQEALFTRPEDYEAHPIGTPLGGFIPSAGFFNPAKGLQDLPKLASGLAKTPQVLGPVGRTALTTAEEQAIFNALMNTVPQAGISTYEQLQGDAPFDYGRLAAETLPGVLMTRPTGLGKKLGFQDPISDSDLRTLFPTDDATGDVPTPPKTEAKPPLSDEELLQAVGLKSPRTAEPKKIKLTPKGLAAAEKQQYALPGMKHREEPTLMERAVERMEGEGGPPVKEVDPEVERTKLKEEIKTELKKEAEAEVKAETPPTLETDAKKKGYDFTPEELEDMKSQLNRESNEALLREAQADVSAMTPEARTKLQRVLQKEAYRRGFSVEEVPEVLGREGKPIAGNIDLKRRRIQISKQLSGEETVPHEAAGHGFLNDLLSSSDSRDVKTAIDALNAYRGKKGKPFTSAEEWRQYAKDNPEEAYIAANSIEETLAKDVALEGYRQTRTTAYGTKAERVKQWWNNTKSRWKKEFGLATDEDMRRHLVARFRGDAPYGTRVEMAPKVGAVTEKGVTTDEATDELRKQEELQGRKEEGTLETRESGEAEGIRIQALNSLAISDPKNAIERAKKASANPKELKYLNTLIEELRGKPDRYITKEIKEKALNSTRQSDEAELPKDKSDYQQYLDVQKKISERIKAGDYSSEEFRALWQENENIKNRNGGMPPSKPVDKAVEEGRKEITPEPTEGKKTEAEGIKDISTRESSDPALPKAKDTYAEEAPDHPSSYSFFGTTTARLDRVAEKIKTPTAKEVTYKLRQANTERDILEGRVGNKLIAATQGYTPEEIGRVYEYRHAIDNDFPEPFKLSPSEKELKKSLDDVYREIGELVQKSGLKVKSGDKFRDIKLRDTGYQQNTLSQKVADAWAESKAEASEYDKAFIEHAKKKGETEADAKNILQEYKQAIGNAGITPDVKFGALRKVEGIGLPWELVEQNFNVAARRYGSRVAGDLAFFKYLQSDPRMQKALGIKDQFGNNPKPEDYGDVDYIGSSPEVKAALRSIYGIDVPPNPIAQSLARVVGANIMQTGTAIRNIAALPTSIAAYYGVNPKSVMQAIGKMHERTNRAFENNAIKSSYKDFDAAGEFEGNPNKFINLADKYVSFMRKWTGRDLSDKFEGLFSYSLGEELAGNWFAQAKDGDIRARAMLNRFGTTVEGGVKKKFLDRKAKITEDDIARVAKEFVDVVRGSYSAGGLPSAAIEGPIAPFLALSRWSIERANNFYKDAVLPIKERGDFLPLLKTSFAALLSGAAIEQLNEMLSNKKGQDPTVKEVALSGDKGDLIAKAIGLAQLGALGGIASDTLKFGANIAQGKDATFASPMSFPLATVAEDFAKKTSFAVEAIHEGEDPFEVLGEYMKEIVRSQSQNSRYIMNRMGEEAKRKEKFRDLRVFKELTGRDVSSARGEANPFLNLRQKEFKKEEDLDKAIGSDLPKVLDDIISRADGDYEKLKKELEGLKRNSYQIFPSLGENPRTAGEYYDYLVKTQGQQEADKRLAEFVEVAQKNKVKSAVVPRL